MNDDQMNDMKSFCLPLMSIDEDRNQLWCCFGTATFAYVRDSFFLVSAAHCFASMNGKPVYVAISPEPISLAGHGVVKNAEMDVAAVKLHLDIVDALSEHVIFVTPEIVNNGSVDQSVCLSEVVGFPSNRNRMKTRGHRVGENVLRYTAGEVSDRFFPDDEYVERVHFALEYDEKSILDENWKQTQPRNMQGMSGGPITEIIASKAMVTGRVQGILLGSKRAKKAIVGLRYEYILAWIDENFGRFPEPRR